tara:strand:+ start:467 stop:907 length:441 start_codon:yes stop_codon:yes gene_type:complete
MSQIEVKNIFGFLEEITLRKSPPEKFTASSWEKWNSYMIHRYVSMNLDYIDIVNYAQKISPQNKQQIYSIYREMIPKKKLWLKYIKNENKKNYQELAEYVAEYFECSLGEADHYIDILQTPGITDILFKMGVEEKEISKMVKKAKL